MDNPDDSKKSDKDFNNLDLSGLQDFSFGTQWTQDKSSPAEKRGRAERPERFDRPRSNGPAKPRRDRRSFGKPASGGARQVDEGEAQRDRREYAGGRRGSDAGFRRGAGQGRQEAQIPYDSPYFSVSFYPEDDSFAALAKTIRASFRTIELFDIARTVVDKNERFIVVLERKKSRDKATEDRIYISVPDGVPFESDDAAVNHVMTHCLEQFFDTEEVEVDPPKGNFQVVNKCGVTGELLGPPNYHPYNQIAQQHFATRIKGMSFEAFRNRIESVRDPEAIAAWLEKMKMITRYICKLDKAAPKSVMVDEKKPETKSASADVEQAGDAPEAQADVPLEASPVAEDTDPGEAGEVGESADPAEPTATEGSETSPVAEAEPEETTPAEAVDKAESAAPSFDSLEEARVYLLTRARDKVVRPVGTARFHGRLLETIPDGEIRRAVQGALERQRHFPLDTANGIRGRLRREHFTIFKKGSKGVSYVCAVKRKFRVPGQTFADSIGALISFIEEHPMIKARELPEKMLGIKPPDDASAQRSDATAAAGDVPKNAAPAATEAVSEAPAPTPPDTAASTGKPDSGGMPVEERAAVVHLQRDLRWLVAEGYVTEFIDGRLFAAPPMPTPKSKSADKKAFAKPDELGSKEDGEESSQAPVEGSNAQEVPLASSDDAASGAAEKETAEEQVEEEAEVSTNQPNKDLETQVHSPAEENGETAEPESPVSSAEAASGEEEKPKSKV